MVMETERMGAERWSQNAEEELRRLREAVARKEEELRSKKESYDRGALVKEELVAYAEAPVPRTQPKVEVLSDAEVEKIVLELAPEAHDDTIGELIGILKEKGLKAALSVVEKMKNPHIEDDFHRFVIEYLKEGFPIRGLEKEGEPWDVLRMTL